MSSGFLSDAIDRGISGFFASRGIDLSERIKDMLNTLWEDYPWGLAIIIGLFLVFVFRGKIVKIVKWLKNLNRSDKPKDLLITLEEAISTFYDNREIPDALLRYFPLPDPQGSFDEFLHERDHPNEKLYKELHWKDNSLPALLTRFFEKGSLALYGSSYRSGNIKKIPLQDIIFAKDFSCLLDSSGDIKYNNLKCNQKKLLKFIRKEKRAGGLLSLDALDHMITTAYSTAYPFAFKKSG